ncbi:hypothetical protein ACFL52_03575 [Candidatus Margulisiibacteriota bacterium]
MELSLTMRPQLRLEQKLVLRISEPQRNLQERAKAAQKILVEPFKPADQFENILAYSNYLGGRLSEIGSTLLGRPLTPEICGQKDFMEIAKIVLTLQAAWKEENDKGINLLADGFGVYADTGSIKAAKYGGSYETKDQLRVMQTLLEKDHSDRAASYIEAWQSDIVMGNFWTTDHFYDWLTMGKVCGGSCQAYDGTPYWNKSLGGPIFSLDKLSFTGKPGTKLSRSLLVPTPVKIGEQIEWDLIVPSVYSQNRGNYDLVAIIKGALYAAGLAGAKRVGLLFSYGGGDGESLRSEALEKAFTTVKDQEINMPIINSNNVVIREEKIIPKAILSEQATILSMPGPNRYKYWDNVGGTVDYDRRKADCKIAGINVPAVELETQVNLIEFERIY